MLRASWKISYYMYTCIYVSAKCCHPHKIKSLLTYLLTYLLTDLDLEADPEELCDLFDLENLELAPFDGSAACDLDSVSDLKISAASSVPFFFSVPEVVCFALCLLDCFYMLSDNGLDVSFVGCFISFLSP